MASRCSIAFAGQGVIVEYDGAKGAEVVELLFRTVVKRYEGASPVDLRVAERAGVASLFRADDQTISNHQTVGTLALTILSACTEIFKQRNVETVVFHAAALAYRGGAILLPGVSGAGKSTLTAWLLTREFAHLTDELASVHEGRVEGLSRAIHLRRGAHELFSSRIEAIYNQAKVATTPEGIVACPTVFSSLGASAPTDLRAIVFPNYVPGAAISLDRLSQAECSWRLFGQLMNLANFPDRCFKAVTAIGRAFPAYSLRYGSFGGLDLMLAGLIDGSSRSTRVDALQ